MEREKNQQRDLKEFANLGAVDSLCMNHEYWTELAQEVQIGLHILKNTNQPDSSSNQLSKNDLDIVETTIEKKPTVTTLKKSIEKYQIASKQTNGNPTEQIAKIYDEILDLFEAHNDLFFNNEKVAAVNTLDY